MMNFSIISVKDFWILIYHYISHKDQINKDWVKKLKDKQYQYKKEFGNFCFPGSIIIVEYYGKWYLADGQHRREVLKEIYQENPDLANLNIILEMYNTNDNNLQLNSIYEMANNRYIINGTINSEGKVYDNNNISKQVAKWLYQVFPKQAGGTNDPKFDCNLVMKFINESNKITDDNVNTLCELILEENIAYGNILYVKDKQKYTKYQALSGFFLPHKTPKCRWMIDILQKL